MKRAHELEDTLEEVVREAKTKDGNGRPLYPVMQDPLIMALFGAPEALFDVLKERPIIILNLLRTNKRLAQFWSQFENLWITLIDALIERVWPMPNSDEIYPYFVITNERIHHLAVTLYNQTTPFRPASFLNGTNVFDLTPSFSLLRPTVRLGKYHGRDTANYSIFYYDPISKLVMDIYRRVQALQRTFEQPINPARFLEEYLDKIGMNVASKKEVVALEEGFFINSERAVTLKLQLDLEYLARLAEHLSDKYAIYFHGPLVSEQVEITKREPPLDFIQLIGVFPQRVAQSLATIIRLISSLGGAVRRMSAEVEPNLLLKATPIDATLAKPYHLMLYDPIRGLFNTQEKQKEFFIEILKELNVEEATESIIERLGESIEQLTCSVCQTKTSMVDPVLQQAFCTLECRAKYNT